MQKIVGDDYSIIVKDKKLYVQGEIKITVDGNASVNVGGTTTVESTGHVKVIAPTVDVGIDNKEPAVLGHKYKAQLDHLIEKFNNHTHIGNLGYITSTPPVTGYVQLWMEARSDTVDIQA